MIVLEGKYNSAKVFTDNIESTAISQIIELCNQEYTKDSKIRIMPDVHAGAGCTIGTTMTIKDKVVPNLVGVDIGCGMKVVKLNVEDLCLKKLDQTIRRKVPFGFSVHELPPISYPKTEESLHNLRCIDKANINLDRVICSIGTLGGGNHFIEVGKDEDGCLYLIVHTGSRNLGKQVATYYQALAHKELNDINSVKEYVIKQLKSKGRQSEIQDALSKIQSKVPKSLAFLEGHSFEDYLFDMKIVQDYAEKNRCAIVARILSEMNLTYTDSFSTIHNYIDMDNLILRKGAVSAQKGERLIIPMNMRDGSLICTGKGDSDWNYSAPHGAGRVYSRGRAKELLSVEEFNNEMSGIYSTCVGESTLDESPMAYKPMKEIIQNIDETVTINKIVKPIYNFKAN